MVINKRQLAVVLVASVVLQTGVAAAIMTGGAAVAVPTAGVGGFTVKFDKLEGQGFTQYATLENTSECQAYPSAVANIQSGTIDGLTLYKDVKVPDSIPGGGQTIRMKIHSNKQVQFTGLKQKFTYLKGDLSMKKQSIDSGVGGNVKNAVTLSAPSIVIRNGQIHAQSQYVRSITLTGTRVQTVVNPENDTDFPKNPCLAQNGSAS